MPMFEKLKSLFGNPPPPPVIEGREQFIPEADIEDHDAPPIDFGKLVEVKFYSPRDREPEKPKAKPLESAASDWETTDQDLHGIIVMIEYVDAKGQASQRRIRIEAIKRHPNKPMNLQAFCFERNARRTFKVERIKSVIDPDGVVHDPKDYFGVVLGVAADKAKPPPQGAHGAAGVEQRRCCVHGWRGLVAMCWADGDMDSAEVDAIVDYIVEEAQHNGLSSNEHDVAAIRSFICRQTPPDADPWDNLFEFEEAPRDVQRRLVNGARAVMEADGVIDPAEKELLDEIMMAFDD